MHAARRSRGHHSDLQSQVPHISIYHLGDHNLMMSSSKTLCRHCFDCFCSPLAITKCFCRLISTVQDSIFQRTMKQFGPVATRTPKINIKNICQCWRLTSQMILRQSSTYDMPSVFGYFCFLQVCFSLAFYHQTLLFPEMCHFEVALHRGKPTRNWFFSSQSM